MDGTDFDITFTFQTENNNERLTFLNKLMKDMAQFGLMSADQFDQTFINGLARIMDHMEFCRGLPVKFKSGVTSKVPVAHKWTELQMNGTCKSWISQHSKACEYLLSFTKELSSQCCTTCVYDPR